MRSFWLFISKPANLAVLGMLGGGVWAVVTYLWPAHEAPTIVCGQEGVAIGGNVSGSAVINTATGSSNSGPCVAPKDAK
jgi:hypothetical protein